ncbi:MAG TPA: hypothetical protein ENK61_05835 [Devosia sp.]|nr:hypothetical protein [Devosia sp.]
MSISKQSAETRVRKFKFAAMLLPIFAILLIVPPLVSMRTTQNAVILGIPANIAYLFGVWLAMIIGAYILQKMMPDILANPPHPEDEKSD